MLFEIRTKAWEALNDIYGEEASERGTFLLNENNTSALCHDFEVQRVYFGEAPQIKYREESILIEYDGNGFIDLDVVLGLDQPEGEEGEGVSFDLLTGLVTTLTRSIQLPLHLRIILRHIYGSFSLASGKVSIESLDIDVEGEIAGTRSAWIRERVKRELESRIRKIVAEIDFKYFLDNWPNLLSDSLSSHNTLKKMGRPSIARTVKSMRSRITFK